MKRNVGLLEMFDTMLQRHEDSFAIGIPDVSFVSVPYQRSCICGWTELKHVHEYPRRASTPVRMKRFTDEQRDWLYDRGKMGACCSVTLQVGRDYYVFTWSEVYRIGELTKEELIAGSVFYSEGRPDWAELWVSILNS